MSTHLAAIAHLIRKLLARLAPAPRLQPIPLPAEKPRRRR